jgi:hypothetical protein
MSAKKQKLRDTTNVTTPEDSKIVKADGAVAATTGGVFSAPSAITADLLATGNQASNRTLEHHFIATVQAVLQSIRQSCSQTVPWSMVAVSVA